MNIGRVALFVALLALGAFKLMFVRAMRASEVPRCRVIEFAARADSTFYEVQCSDRTKIKEIIEVKAEIAS